MARIQLEELVEHLDIEMRAALRAAVREVLPDAEINDDELFRAFRGAVRRSTERWQRVPERCVRD